MTVEQRVELKLQEMVGVIADKVAERIAGKSSTPKPKEPPIKTTDRTNLPKRPRSVKINELPIAGVKYFIGADIAEGIGGKSDASTFSVVRIDSDGKIYQVAWYSNNQIDPVDFAEVLDAIGRFYYDAVLAPEVNRFDSTLWSLRTKWGYPSLYRWKRVDAITTTSNMLGWWTTAATKPRIVHNLLRLRRLHKIVINDAVALKQCDPWTGKGDAKDDAIKALMIAAWIATESNW